MNDETAILERRSPDQAAQADAEATVASAKRRKMLGQTLIERGLLTEDQLRIALIEQKSRGLPIGKVLVLLGFLTERTLREQLAANLGHQAIDLSKVVPSPLALARIPREFAKRHWVFPVSIDERDRTLTLAMINPNDVVVVDQVNAQLRGDYRLIATIAAEGEIAAAIDQHYGHELSIDGILNEIETGELDLASLDAMGREYSGPVVRLVDSILADAIQRQVSDIHFEPEAGFLRIRYRIDGVMRQIRALHGKFWPAMLVRLKLVSGMNIAESRSPQDGRISLIMNGRQIDFRVAAQPTIHGENFVLRVLDRSANLLTLEQMGISTAQLDTIEALIARPEGIVLVTGPTGSGKTTTLYSILSRLNNESVNIMTLEDPVEYPLPMVRQTNLASSVKMEFASGIRSLMRQDPDIILVGEVRDADTATMALRAAMTGHQVFSTLHTNSAVGAIPRLFDLGLSADTLAGNLIGIIGQRLVRRLCLDCRQPFRIDAEMAAALAQEGYQADTLNRAVGCARCEYQGYRGRLPLLEVLKVDDDIDVLISARAPSREILRAARLNGYRTLADDALRRVVDGSTTLEEAARVVDLTHLGRSRTVTA